MPVLATACSVRAVQALSPAAAAVLPAEVDMEKYLGIDMAISNQDFNVKPSGDISVVSGRKLPCARPVACLDYAKRIPVMAS